MTAPKALHDDVWANWNRWFDRAIKDVYWLHSDRTMFVQVRDAIVENGPDDTGSWLTHYARCYRDKQAMAIRRVMDTDRKAEAFGRLFQAMEQSPEVFTFERLLAATEATDEWLLADMRKQFADVMEPGTDHIDPAWVCGVHAELRHKVAAVLAYADRLVAHADQHGQKVPLTWAELHAAVDALGQRIQHFGLTFRAALYEMEPVVQDDWKSTFRRPIFKPHPVRWPWGYPDF